MENKIKSAEDFLWEYGESVSDGWQSTYIFSSVIVAMKKYVEYIVEAQLEIAAEEAEVTHEYRWSPIGGDIDFPIVDPKSIKNCTRIKLD